MRASRRTHESRVRAIRQIDVPLVGDPIEARSQPEPPDTQPDHETHRTTGELSGKLTVGLERADAAELGGVAAPNDKNSRAIERERTRCLLFVCKAALILDA